MRSPKVFEFLVAVFLLLFSSISSVAQEPNSAELSAQFREEARKSARLATYLRDRIDHSAFDLNTLANKLGPNPSVIVEHVRQAIGYRPYYGALKGPEGLLLDRLGNSLDRSLLTHHLLVSNGIKARIVQADLSEIGQVALQELVSHPRPEIPPLMKVDVELLSILLQELGMTRDRIKAALSPPEDKQQIWNIIDEYLDFHQRAKDLLKHHTNPQSKPPKVAPTPGLEFFFVEYLDVGTGWVVADTYPGIRLGDVVSERIAEYSGAEAIPEVYQHLVTVEAFSVVDRNGLTEETFLGGFTYSTQDAINSPIIAYSKPVLERSGQPQFADLFFGATDGLVDRFEFGLIADGQKAVQVQLSRDGSLVRMNEKEANETALNILTKQLQQISPNQSEVANGQLVSLKLRYRIVNSMGQYNPPRTVEVERVLSSSWEVGSKAWFGQAWQGIVNVIPFDVEPTYFAYNSLLARLNGMETQVSMIANTPKSVSNLLPYLRRQFHLGKAFQTAMLATQFANINKLERGDSEGHYYGNGVRMVVEEVQVIKRDRGLLVNNALDLVQIAHADNGRKLDSTNLDSLAWTFAEDLLLSEAVKATNVLNVEPVFLQGATDGFYARFEAADGAKQTDAKEENYGLPGIKYEEKNGWQTVRLISASGPLWFSIDPNTGMIIGRTESGRGSATETSLTTAQKIDLIFTVIDFAVCLGTKIQKTHLDFLTQFAHGGAADNGQFMWNLMSSGAECTLTAAGNFAGAMNPWAAVINTVGQTAFCLYKERAAGNGSPISCFITGAVGLSGPLGDEVARLARGSRAARNVVERNADVIAASIGALAKVYNSSQNGWDLQASYVRNRNSRQ